MSKVEVVRYIYAALSFPLWMLSRLAWKHDMRVSAVIAGALSLAGIVFWAWELGLIQ